MNDLNKFFSASKGPLALCVALIFCGETFCALGDVVVVWFPVDNEDGEEVAFPVALEAFADAGEEVAEVDVLLAVLATVEEEEEGEDVVVLLAWA